MPESFFDLAAHDTARRFREATQLTQEKSEKMALGRFSDHSRWLDTGFDNVFFDEGGFNLPGNRYFDDYLFTLDYKDKSAYFERVESKPKFTIGVTLQHSDKSEIVVASMTSGCAAEKAGVRVGDRLLGVDREVPDAVKELSESETRGANLKIKHTN